MDDINIHDYNIESADKYSSDFLNQVVGDFTDAISGLYKDYKDLTSRYSQYLQNMNEGLDWMTEQVGILASGTYEVSGYSDPVSSSNLDLEKLFGMFHLETINVESKISRYVDNQSVTRAYSSNKIYKFESSNWVEDTTMREVIDNTTYIWSEELAEDELYIAITSSSSASVDKQANIIEVVPFAGTLIKTVEWKTTSGTFESIEVNSKLPVRIVGDFDYSDEVRVLLGGVSKDGNYLYSLRYVNIYRCDFMDSGTAVFSIGSWADVAAITLNDDYIDDALKLKKPIRIELLSDDLSYTYYDSNVDPFPLQSVVNIGLSAETLKLRITLIKTEEVTPVIKWVNVE